TPSVTRADASSRAATTHEQAQPKRAEDERAHGRLERRLAWRRRAAQRSVHDLIARLRHQLALPPPASQPHGQIIHLTLLEVLRLISERQRAALARGEGVIIRRT